MLLVLHLYSSLCTTCWLGSYIAANTVLTNLLNPSNCIKGQKASQGQTTERRSKLYGTVGPKQREKRRCAAFSFQKSRGTCGCYHQPDARSQVKNCFTVALLQMTCFVITRRSRCHGVRDDRASSMLCPSTTTLPASIFYSCPVYSCHAVHSILWLSCRCNGLP